MHLHEIGTQGRADPQMRERFRDLVNPSLPVPKLYGISAMGTCFSVYEYTKDTGRLTPSMIAPDPEIINDVAPQARWDYELLEPAGEVKFRSIVTEIKAVAQAIGNCEPFLPRSW